MDKKIHLTIVLEMPEETEKKNSLFRFFAVDNSFQGGKIIAAMIGDAIADLERLKNVSQIHQTHSETESSDITDSL